MTDAIHADLFRHLVDLAALELNDEEADYLLAELNKQLRSIDELLALSIPADTSSARHGVSYTPETSPALRSDEWNPDPNSKSILEQAPQVADGFFIVPEIPHTDL